MNYLFLSNTNLFRVIKEDEIRTVLSCLNAYEREFKKDEVIYRAGDCVSEIGLVESGSVNIVVNFYWGNSNIFGHIESGKIFAETYAAVAGRIAQFCSSIWTSSSPYAKAAVPFISD